MNTDSTRPLFCQRCRQPLKVDESLAELKPSAMDLLIAAPLEAEEEKVNPPVTSSIANAIPDRLTEPISRRTTTSNKSNRNSLQGHNNLRPKDTMAGPSESFVMLSSSQIAPSVVPQVSTLKSEEARNNSMSRRLKVANKLFDIMSAKSDIDHPMCQECTDILLESLRRQLDDVSKERDCYIEFLKKVSESKIDPAEEKILRKEIEELTDAENQVNETLRRTEEERDTLQKELEELEAESKKLEAEEEEFWQKSNEFQLKLQAFHNERDSINMKYDHDAKQYEKLQKTVVYNDTFCIGHSGPFGTINGFRLGRLSSQPIEWSEINAAMGQTLLLLYTVANKLKFQFKTYRLVPMGSFSRIQKIDGDSVVTYELYGSGDFAINRMFLNRRFDHALVALLNCLQQLSDFAEQRDKSLRLPYRINKDKIGDTSIRLQFNQDELWTRALKYMLTNMKWILIFASRGSVALGLSVDDGSQSPPAM
ncbi:autophagy protein Apg6-domain-containing protein [Umbelopsis sp. PMI_123]|nr:autophagy protein Apg6-domain-containing protein [Umbelopsis sp. PMI_123]